MSELAKLEEKLESMQKVIANRVQSANDKKLPGMICDVAMNDGKYTDYGGGEYHFSEEGLSISYSTYNQKYIKVDLGYETKDVFRASLLPNGVGEISLYIPGSWEARIETLFNEIPKKQQDKKKQSIQKEINKLKETWQLEEI